MAIGINSGVNNITYSTERVSVPSSNVKMETAPEPKENMAASVQGYSVTPSDKSVENNQANNSESGKKKDQQPTEKEVKNKIDMANNELRHAKTGLNFKYHEATKRVSITVYDKETKEIIREIPPEKSLDMLEKMWELAGMVVDDRR